MKRLITVLALGPVLLLAACGGSEKESSPEAASAAANTPTATATPAETATPAATKEAVEPAAKKVAIQGFAYGPGTVKVKAGDTITWTNDDSAPHTVTAKSGGDVDSGTLEKGASFEYTPEQAGTIEYFCAIHPDMLGTIEVD